MFLVLGFLRLLSTLVDSILWILPGCTPLMTTRRLFSSSVSFVLYPICCIPRCNIMALYAFWVGGFTCTTFAVTLALPQFFLLKIPCQLDVFRFFPQYDWSYFPVSVWGCVRVTAGCVAIAGSSIAALALFLLKDLEAIFIFFSVLVGHGFLLARCLAWIIFGQTLSYRTQGCCALVLLDRHQHFYLFQQLGALLFKFFVVHLFVGWWISRCFRQFTMRLRDYNP